jgi:hypothetical protein
VGEARQVNLSENASAKRKGRGRPAKKVEHEDALPAPVQEEITQPAVSFTTIFEAENEKDNHSGAGDR